MTCFITAKRRDVCWLVSLSLLLLFCVPAWSAEKRIMAFCGAASKPAMEDATTVFGQKTGIKIDLNFGGSGTMLSQMKIARRGDLYIPGSPDYMVIAEKQNLVDPKTTQIVAYLVPAINVQPGNPKNIRTLADLARPGIKIGIGNPEAVCVGLYAVELLERNRLLEAVQKNIVTHAPSCDATEALVALKKVDAVIGWEVFSHWNPGKIETIMLKPHEIPRLAYIPVAVSVFERGRAAAEQFIGFLVAAEGRAIFARHGYAVTEAEVRSHAPAALIGGEYKLPASYQPR
jgi:molybdate transport system substrate-binding protein